MHIFAECALSFLSQIQSCVSGSECHSENTCFQVEHLHIRASWGNCPHQSRQHHLTQGWVIMVCAEHLLGVGHGAEHLSVCALSISVRLGLLLSHLWNELGAGVAASGRVTSKVCVLGLGPSLCCIGSRRTFGSWNLMRRC